MRNKKRRPQNAKYEPNDEVKQRRSRYSKESDDFDSWEDWDADDLDDIAGNFSFNFDR